MNDDWKPERSWLLLGRHALTIAELMDQGPGTYITVYDLQLGTVAQGPVTSVDENHIHLADLTGNNQDHFTVEAAGLVPEQRDSTLTILTSNLQALRL
ncbi:MAG TPA: hypothetical protein VLA88_06460 [Candidatus Saccharimonadales bacterium]|nr:hypothetical protein [Candidatus Saccharimonadales bacterium]